MSKKTTVPKFVYEVRWFDAATDEYKYTTTPTTRPHYSSASQPRQIINKWIAKKEQFDIFKEEGFPDYMTRVTRVRIVGPKGIPIRNENGSYVYEEKTHSQEELNNVFTNPWFESLKVYPKIFKLTMGVIKEEEID